MARSKSDSVSLADVAARARTSITTVSHVVRGTRYVSPELTARVERAVAEPGYRGGDVRTPALSIGLALTVASNPYLADLILGVQSEAARSGIQVLVCETNDRTDELRDAVRSLSRRRVSGLIAAPTQGWEAEVLPLLREHEVPLVVVDRLTRNLPIDQVGTDSRPAAAYLVEHLIGLGHRRIAVVHGRRGLGTTGDRILGYRDALATAGIEFDPALLVNGDSTLVGGRQAMLSLLDCEPTAVFVANNAMTVGALLALRERAVAFPEDLAVVAFDDLDISPLLGAPPTVMAQPLFAMGARAAQLLFRRIQDPMVKPQTVRLPAIFEHRRSCGCDPGAGRRT